MNESALMNLVRVGTVSSVSGNTARVAFADKQDSAGSPHISAPLQVLKNAPFIPTQDVAQQTEIAEGHRHGVTITPWMPKVGELVVCLFLPNGGGDGFVLGTI
jgi:hypothetical protein